VNTLTRLIRVAILCIAYAAVVATLLSAQEGTARGVSASEIRIGNITCTIGMSEAYAAVAHSEAAYFRMINDRGGISGRKIIFVSREDGCQRASALELARLLVEKEDVLLLFSVLGTEANLAIRAYMNEKQVPQLFIESSSSVFNDPDKFPWTMGFFATYLTEGRAYAKYVLQNKPSAKIGVLSPDNDVGKEFVAGLRDGLGKNGSSKIVREITYNDSDRDLTAAIRTLKDSGAEVFMNFSIGAFATEAIRAASDLDWRPMQFIPNASLSVAAFLEPAGLQKSTGIISNARSKRWMGSASQQDPAVRGFLEWMSKYNPQGNLRDQNNVAGYERAEALVEVLKRCGDDLTRANVMKQASHLNLGLGMLRPGIRVTTSASDYQPIKQLFLIRFDGKEWTPLGPITSE
jgi:branched-chain amino acid transport system substrate-binding protein